MLREISIGIAILVLTGCGPSVEYVYPPEEHQADYLARRHEWRVAHFEREQDDMLRADRYQSLFARVVPNEENLWRNEGKKPAPADLSIRGVEPALPPPRM